VSDLNSEMCAIVVTEQEQRRSRPFYMHGKQIWPGRLMSWMETVSYSACVIVFTCGSYLLFV
jgi:hypothetical protein